MNTLLIEFEDNSRPERSFAYIYLYIFMFIPIFYFISGITSPMSKLHGNSGFWKKFVPSAIYRLLIYQNEINHILNSSIKHMHLFRFCLHKKLYWQKPVDKLLWIISGLTFGRLKFTLCTYPWVTSLNDSTAKFNTVLL